MSGKKWPDMIIRTAFLLEAAGNLFGGTAMLLYPRQILTMLTVDSIPATTTVTLLQWLGALTYGLTPQLLWGLPNTSRAIASRRQCYETLLAGEACLVGIMLWQTIIHDEHPGLTQNSLMVSIGTLLPIALWRIYVLVYRPDWLGAVVISGQNLKKRQ